MRFIGDIHGNTRRYVDIANESPDGISIQVGDFGMGFSIDYDILTKLNGENYFIRGNHDSPNKCHEYLNFGKNNTRLSWVEDGMIWNYRNKLFLFIGGAFSIDQERRVDGVSWWHDEELTINQFNIIIDKISKYPRFDYIITHDCPELGCKKIDKYYKNFTHWNSRTRHALQSILEINQPKHWIHGHWHISKNYKLGKTKVYSLAEYGFIDIPC